MLFLSANDIDDMTVFVMHQRSTFRINTTFVPIAAGVIARGTRRSTRNSGSTTLQAGLAVEAELQAASR